MWDREKVYTQLKKHKVPVPKHYFAFKNPKKYINDDYNRKEIQQEISKKYKKKGESEIFEEEDNVDNVINFL